MQAILLVGIGGFIGSVGRYGLGKLPITTEYPLMTMLINLLGALVIGFVSELTKNKTSPNVSLFITTGLCGGFTTFSTFSLETFTLLKNGKHLIGISYATSSVIVCFIGVWLGFLLAGLARTKLTG